MKQVEHTKGIFQLPGFTYSNISNQYKWSNIAGYHLAGQVPRLGPPFYPSPPWNMIERHITEVILAQTPPGLTNSGVGEPGPTDGEWATGTRLTAYVELKCEYGPVGMLLQL